MEIIQYVTFSAQLPSLCMTFAVFISAGAWIILCLAESYSPLCGYTSICVTFGYLPLLGYLWIYEFLQYLHIEFFEQLRICFLISNLILPIWRARQTSVLFLRQWPTRCGQIFSIKIIHCQCFILIFLSFWENRSIPLREKTSQYTYSSPLLIYSHLFYNLSGTGSIATICQRPTSFSGDHRSCQNVVCKRGEERVSPCSFVGCSEIWCETVQNPISFQGLKVLSAGPEIRPHCFLPFVLRAGRT